MDKKSNYNIEVKYNENTIIYNALRDSIIYFTSNEYPTINYLFKELDLFSLKYPSLYKELRKNGFIIDSDFDELAYIRLQNKRCIFANNNYHITINPTLDCNLSCWYCSTEYAKAKHCGGMNSSTVDNIKSHIKFLIEDQRAESIHLDWFGGEPMLYFNEVIVPISSYAKKIAAHYGTRITQHMTTNATLINEENLLQMKELEFSSFQIPIDGNEKHHNEIKYYKNRKGTYQTVISNINKLVEFMPLIKITLRINYDKQTLKHIEEIIPDISEKAKRRIRVDFQKIWQIKCNADDTKLLIDKKNLFAAKNLKSDFWAFIPNRFHRCYADKFHHYAINYDGKVFKCTAQDYGEDKVIGNLLDNGHIYWNDKLLSKLFSEATFENPEFK